MDARLVDRYVARQLSNFQPDRDVAPEELSAAVDAALGRFEKCQENRRGKYVSRELDHLNTDHYAAFLYYLSNGLSHAGRLELASKVYGLNKALHALDVFYEVELPEVFALQHPVGTVLGRGKFASYFFVYQRCSVGSNLAGVYPRFREGVVMFGGASVIGDSEIGPNTWISVGTTIMDQSVPGDCVVFGRSPNLIVKPTRRSVVRDLFGVRS